MTGQKERFSIPLILLGDLEPILEAMCMRWGTTQDEEASPLQGTMTWENMQTSHTYITQAETRTTVLPPVVCVYYQTNKYIGYYRKRDKLN